jgi:hypothetical protein
MRRSPEAGNRFKAKGIQLTIILSLLPPLLPGLSHWILLTVMSSKNIYYSEKYYDDKYEYR